jgi:hypothetical protein
MAKNLSKARQKEVFKLLVNQSKIAVEFAENSPEQDFALLVTRDLPIVYAEMPKPRFCILLAKSYQGSYRALHIWKSTKWVPLTATKIFATGRKSTASGSKKKKVLAAMRTVIKPQIDNFKAEISLPAKCALTGKTLTSLSGRYVHVDHFKLPFSHIVEEWLLECQLTFERIDLDRTGNFKNRALEQSFYAYHKARADLKLVDKTANLKKGAKIL